MKITNKITNWRSTIKHHVSYLGLISLALCIQACEPKLLDENADIDTLIPEPAVATPDRPSPSEYALVMTTSANEIFDASTNPVLLRGINLQYGDNPEVRLAGIAAIKETGANVVRLQLRANTTAAQLEAALDEIVAQNMIAMPVLWEAEGEITCTEDSTYIEKYTQELWFDKWIDVLVKDKYQPHLMINIANEWGIRNVWNANSVGYADYIEVYKGIIREFRDIGFKVPLVIDAPDCGQDYKAFLAERGLELQAADLEKNIVLSVHAYGAKFNTSNKIVEAADLLTKEGIPFIIGEFGGSGEGATSIDHQDLMAKGIGDYALIFNLPWGGDTDKAGYAYSLEEATSFIGANLSADVYTPLDYVKDGNLSVQMYLRDSAGHYASLGTKRADDKELRGNAWTTISYSMQSNSDLAFVEEGFDLADVAKIGIEVLANGKASDVNGDIKFDNIKAEVGGAEPAMYHATFDGDTQSWGIGWTGSEVYAEEGNLVLHNDWTTADQIVFTISGSNANLDSNALVNIATRIFIPEEYADATGFYFKFFFQHGDDWTWSESSAIALADLILGEWNDVVFENIDLAQMGTMQVVGAMVGGITTAKNSNILIDSIAVLGEGQSLDAGGSGPMYYPTFDADEENWSLKWGTSEITASSGALSLMPDWETTDGNKFGFGVSGGNANLDTSAPVTINTKVFIPASYADESSLYFKFYAMDEGWSWFATNDLLITDFTPGEWTTIVIENFDLTAGVHTFQQFGIEIGGVSAAKTEPILIDHIAVLGEGQTIEGANVELDTLFDLHFAEQADADAWMFDYAEGGFNESVLEEAKLYNYGVVPFGWLSWSWKGNGEGFEHLDMSTSENSVELTTRGEEIVNGVNGIKATAIEAGFGQ